MAALAHGKAIVTARPPVPLAAFRNRENMIWPDVYRPESFADVLRNVLDDERLRSELQVGALKLAERYEWSGIARQTQRFFESIVEEA